MHSFIWVLWVFIPPEKNTAVVIYGIKLAAGYLRADAFNKTLLSSESSRVSSQKGPFIAWSISMREVQMRSSLSYWCCEIQAYKQSRGWNVRRQGKWPKEAESTGEQEEFPQNSWFSYCIGQ